MRKAISLILFFFFLNIAITYAGWELDWLSPVGVTKSTYYPSDTALINFSFNYTATAITLNPGNSANCSIINKSSEAGSYGVLYSTNLTNNTFFNYTATMVEGRVWYYSSCVANGVHYNSSERIIDIDVDYYKWCIGENCAVNISMDSGQIQTKGGIISANYTGTVIGYYTATETNTTIDSKLTGQQYNASINYTEFGTPSSVPDNQINLTWFYDSQTYNITLASGSNGLVHYMNFTASDINRLCYRTKLFSPTPTNLKIQIDLWDKSLNDWESYGDVIIASSDFEVQCLEILDGADHIINGEVPVKFESVGTSKTTQKFMIDFLWVLDGYTPIAGSEIDPHAWHIDGDNILINDISAGGYTIYDVNINTTNLTISEELHLLANTTGRICGNLNAGDIYYDNATNKFYGCNSTDWSAFN